MFLRLLLKRQRFVEELEQLRVNVAGYSRRKWGCSGCLRMLTGLAAGVGMMMGGRHGVLKNEE